MKTKIFQFCGDTRGASAIVVALCIFLLLTVVGLVVDMGQIYVVRQELQNAADAGADAGAVALFWLGTGAEPTDAANLLSCDYARLKAKEVVQVNKAAGQALTLPDADVLVGEWKLDISTGDWYFQSLPCDAANAYTINAVRVTTRRSSAVNGPVPLIFASFLGMREVELTAQATALLGWVRELRPGGGFPLAVGDNYVPPVGQKMWVTFNSNNTDTGGWHSFKHPAASASYIQDLINGTEKSDPIKIGDYIEMQNGVVESTVNALAKEFTNVHKGKWCVILPVVPGSTNYTQQKEVVGFVAFDIVEISKTSKSVSGWVRGGYIAPKGDTGSPSGSSSVALKASLPKLVE